MKVLLRNRITGLSTPSKRNFKSNINDLNQNSLSDEFGIDDSCFNCKESGYVGKRLLARKVVSECWTDGQRTDKGKTDIITYR